MGAQDGAAWEGLRGEDSSWGGGAAVSQGPDMGHTRRDTHTGLHFLQESEHSLSDSETTRLTQR